MTWREWQVARQLLAEEQLGVYARAGAQQEDVRFGASLDAARKESR